MKKIEGRGGKRPPKLEEKADASCGDPSRLCHEILSEATRSHLQARKGLSEMGFEEKQIELAVSSRPGMGFQKALQFMMASMVRASSAARDE